MTIKNEDELNFAFEQAKHQLEIEGFTITKEDERIIKDVASGKLSRKELIEKLKDEE